MPMSDTMRRWSDTSDGWADRERATLEPSAALVIADTLRRLDPQMSGVFPRAERVTEALREAGMLRGS